MAEFVKGALHYASMTVAKWRRGRFGVCALGCLTLFACGARSELSALDGNDASIARDAAADVPATDSGPDVIAESGRDGGKDADADARVPGWPYTWGASGNDSARVVAVGPDSSIVIAGLFEGTVDFDPTEATDLHTSNGGTDVFVSKFTADGAYLWTQTWGAAPSATRDDNVYGLTITSNGAILVTGTFATTVDFDPGPGVDDHSPPGADFSAFVTELDSNGNHVWTRVWGSGQRTSAWGVGSAPDGSIFVAGAFDETVDLDPGSGVDAHTSNGDIDAYTLKLDATGTFVWGRAWGGSGSEENVGMLGVDGAGNVTVGGTFQSTVDFDPGPGVDNRTALGGYDLFVVRFAPDGTRTWAQTVDTIGGAELPIDLVTTSDGSVAVAGIFYGTVDFDPSGGVDTHKAGAQYDAFVMRLNANGSYAWTSTFGGANFAARTMGETVAMDSAGRVIVGGDFDETVDFDPGPAVVSRTAVGNGDMYLLRLTSLGHFDSVQTWGGSGLDLVYDVAASADSSLFAVGTFGSSVDFSVSPPPDVRKSLGSNDAFALHWIP